MIGRVRPQRGVRVGVNRHVAVLGACGRGGESGLALIRYVVVLGACGRGGESRSGPWGGVWVAVVMLGLMRLMR